MKQHVSQEISSGHGFLESPRWHSGKLWLSDFFRQHVITIDGARVEEQIKVNDSPSGLGFLADGSFLVVTMHEKSVLRVAPDGQVTTHADLSSIAVGAANDMLVTASGDAYVGNFGFDVGGGEEPRPTNIAHITPDGTVRLVPGDVTCPNGMGILPDGRTFVVAETFAQRISAFDCADDGSLTNYRTWAPLPEGFNPDGLCVDADGGVWFANVFDDGPAGAFYRVEEGGEITDTIPVDGTWAVACTFGGPENSTLYLVCNTTSLEGFFQGISEGHVRTADVGRHGI
ncbi:SMP-30/gluconolactonase/LRE family protein [Rhodococcus erythropolis]